MSEKLAGDGVRVNRQPRGGDVRPLFVALMGEGVALFLVSRSKTYFKETLLSRTVPSSQAKQEQEEECEGEWDVCGGGVATATCGFDAGIFFEQADVAAIFFGIAEATWLAGSICFTGLSKLPYLFLSALFINDSTIGTCRFLCVASVGG